VLPISAAPSQQVLRVGAGNRVIPCDLGILADQPAESAPSQDLGICAWSRRLRTPGRRAVPQGPVRAMSVAVIGVLAEDQPQLPFTRDQPPRHARRALAIQRPAIAFALGARTRRDKPSSDTARVTTKKISFKPTSRRSSHAPAGQDRPSGQRTADSGASGQVAQVFGTYRVINPLISPHHGHGDHPLSVLNLG
jgi:hypothetical protein